MLQTLLRIFNSVIFFVIDLFNANIPENISLFQDDVINGFLFSIYLQVNFFLRCSFNVLFYIIYYTKMLICLKL